jgi:hypothetical protein
MTVFGLTLGAPFTVSECDKDSRGYSLRITKVCFERLFGKIKESAPVVTESVRIRFPVSDSPSLARGGELSAQIIDGILEGISFSTRGIADIDRVMGALTQKYGEPTMRQPQVLQNRLGAKFESVDAAWVLPNLDVHFGSSLGTVDSGAVFVSTRKGAEFRSRRLKETLKDRRPL